MGAQMQKPATKAKKESMVGTWHKDWVKSEDLQGPKARMEAEKKKRQRMKRAKQNESDEEDRANLSSTSSHYDPLADSDCSSAEGGSPKFLSKDEMQDAIKTQMRDKVGIQHIGKGFWKGLVSMSDPEQVLDENGFPVDKAQDDATSFQIIKKMMRLKAK